MRRAFVTVLLLAGCDTVFQLKDPGTTDAVVAVDDAGRQCIANHGANDFGLIRVCLDAPEPALPARASLNTGVRGGDRGDCAQVIEQTDAERTEACIVGAHTIAISGVLEVYGQRPLVLAAIGDIAVHGLIDVSSRRSSPRKGAGATYPGCDGGTGTRGSSSGGGGGAGGSFGRVGGAGGMSGPGTGGSPRGAVEPSVVRGGCDGGNGGGAFLTVGDGGLGGQSGGAVYLLAGGTVMIDGRINASGEGALGGIPHGAYGDGGGGGGSGGLIGIDGATVVLVAGSLLVANGGGGGGGSGGNSSVTAGGPGGEADLGGSFPFAGGGGGGGNGTALGGQGGSGGVLLEVGSKGSNTTSDPAGGGGGGGGLGHILVFSPTVTDNGMSTPPITIK